MKRVSFPQLQSSVTVCNFPDYHSGSDSMTDRRQERTGQFGHYLRRSQSRKRSGKTLGQKLPKENKDKEHVERKI
jgi:hypothetical protein